MSREAWSIEGADGQPILGDTHLPEAPPRGVLVICHGFKGYKDYGFFPPSGRRGGEAWADRAPVQLQSQRHDEQCRDVRAA